MAVSLAWLPVVCEKVNCLSVREKFKYLAVTVHAPGGGGKGLPYESDKNALCLT